MGPTWSLSLSQWSVSFSPLPPAVLFPCPCFRPHTSSSILLRFLGGGGGGLSFPGSKFQHCSMIATNRRPGSGVVGENTHSLQTPEPGHSVQLPWYRETSKNNTQGYSCLLSWVTSVSIVTLRPARLRSRPFRTHPNDQGPLLRRLYSSELGLVSIHPRSGRLKKCLRV